jgi:hypothetical protein
MPSTPHKRWARVRPHLAWKRPGLPTEWTRVLDRNEEAMKPEPQEGFVWLDTPGKVLHALERDLDLVDTCIYCGAAPGETRDDVPPKNLFLSPLPPNVVKAPACQPCNAGFSKDDEYARLALYIRSDDVMAHPTARALQPDAWRAFDRPEAQAFTEAFCRLTEIVSVKLPSGEIAEVLIHNIDERVIGWLARITKGLCYHHAGAPLPRGFRVSVGVEPQLHHLLDMPELIDKLNAQPLVDIGAGVFQYRRLVNHVKVGVSLWSMRF